MPVSMRHIRIIGANTPGADEREQPVDHEPQQRQDGQQPRETRHGLRKRVRAPSHDFLEEHQPFIRLMFCRFTVCR